MFRIAEDSSSGSLVQWLAKNYKNGSIVSVDMDKVGVMAAYPDPLCVCVVHCIWKHGANMKIPDVGPCWPTCSEIGNQFSGFIYEEKALLNDFSCWNSEAQWMAEVKVLVSRLKLLVPLQGNKCCRRWMRPWVNLTILQSNVGTAVAQWLRCCAANLKVAGCRSQWPRGLRRRSAAARLLGLWVRIPPGAWMSVCCECCVLSGRVRCDGLITRPE